MEVEKMRNRHVLTKTFTWTLVLLLVAIHKADGVCTYPVDLQGATWDSSDMGVVTFNATQFTATNVVDFGSLTFTCQETSNAMYYSLSNTFNYLGANFKVALCYTFERKTATKFIYYPMTSVLGSTDINRVFFKPSTYSFTLSEVCDVSTTSIHQTRVLIKQGSATEASINCHNDISGRYEYNVTGVTCADTWMDACTDQTKVTFNYSLCATKMAYSQGGDLTCVWDASDASTYYTLLYNNDASTDESTYFKFTCMVSTTSGGRTNVTTYPRACIETQNANTVPSPGSNFFMIPNNTCYVYDATSAAVLSAGGAVAVSLGILALVGAVLVIGIIYFVRVKRKKQIGPGPDGEKIPIADKEDVDTKNLDGRVSPFFPFPTVSEIALSRFGPSEIEDDDGGMTLGATTPGFTDGRRTMYGKDVERESQASLPVYSEIGGDTPEPTRLSEVHTRMSEISEVNIADPTPFTMTRATMNIPEEDGVSPLQSPEPKPNGTALSPRDNDTVKKSMAKDRSTRARWGPSRAHLPRVSHTATYSVISKPAVAESLTEHTTKTSTKINSSSVQKRNLLDHLPETTTENKQNGTSKLPMVAKKKEKIKVAKITDPVAVPVKNQERAKSAVVSRSRSSSSVVETFTDTNNLLKTDKAQKQIKSTEISRQGNMPISHQETPSNKAHHFNRVREQETSAAVERYSANLREPETDTRQSEKDVRKPRAASAVTTRKQSHGQSINENENESKAAKSRKIVKTRDLAKTAWSDVNGTPRDLGDGLPIYLPRKQSTATLMSSTLSLRYENGEWDVVEH